jgi:NTP pyrophosphatase (non-canonical NTP hydrolase)
MTNTKNLMSEISQFVEERDWNQFHSPKNLSMALGIEVVEQQEHFQWLTQKQSMNFKTINIKQEQPKLDMTCCEHFHAGYFSC